jgi:hypothetical protein
MSDKYLPKVGENCEIKHASWDEWKVVTVVAITNQYLIVSFHCDAGNACSRNNKSHQSGWFYS